MSKDLNQKFWNDKYLGEEIPWDVGSITPPIKNYIDSLTDQSMSILIPGAGRGHEAIYLHQKGFANVWVCDWAQGALDALKKLCPSFPSEHLICNNFFELDAQYDLILEQTFFCAISPDLRTSYVKKVADLLHSNKCLVGLLFAEEFSFSGPPFGGNKKEYTSHFESYFQIEKMEICNSSIKPRLGRELFLKLIKKN